MDYNYKDMSAGFELPSILKPAISRTTLALFCGASNDHNPIHIDLDFAKTSGFDDVFAHGMLPMAYLGQLLTTYFPQESIRSFEVRFSAITNINDKIKSTAKVVKKYIENNENILLLELKASDQNNEIKLLGSATIAFK